MSKNLIIKIANYLKLLCLLFIVFSIFYFGYYYFFNPYDLILKDEVTYLEVNSLYVESGYRVISLRDMPNDIVISNNVDINHVGEYEVIYRMGKIKRIRTVKVIDSVKPEITILKSNVFYCPNKSVIDYGVKVYDNYDKDITNKVKTTILDDKIVYEVSDSSGNVSIKIRKLVKKDNVSPKINLKKNITIYKGSKLSNTYSAKDNCDGNITNKVKVKGNVNVNKTGVYYMTYTVSDSSYNTVSVKQKITVVPKDGSRKIYLTFDDGPSTNMTPLILDILKKYDVKATFFVINHGSYTDYLIKREYEEGHSVGLHSYSHRYDKIYKSEDAYFNDLEKIENKVFKITNSKTNIIRFPGGSSNTVSKAYKKKIMTNLTKKVEEKGYIYFDWNVGSNDTSTKNYKKICNNVTSTLGNGINIVLMHDNADKTSNAKALECIIKYGVDNKYEFDKITNDTMPVHHGINN